MKYKDRIKQLMGIVPQTIVDMKIPRKRGRAPTQAFSEFLTNREQGDWAERLVLHAVNKRSDEFIAVQYGKSENKVVGEEGFDRFYEAYQDELERIGKRPDVLIFRKKDYDPDWNLNISTLPGDDLDRIVPKAKGGIEIRSSSFLMDKYDAETRRKQKTLRDKVLLLK